MILLLAGVCWAREEVRRGRVRRLHLPGQRTEEQGSARGENTLSFDLTGHVNPNELFPSSKNLILLLQPFHH